MTIDLDDREALRRVDAQDMLGLTAAYAAQWREGLRLAESQFPGGPRPGIANVILLGTGGGSAASGHLLRSYLFDRLQVPFVVNQGYRIPAWVGPGTLALAVTHSGNTEETLSAFEQARERGAALIAITAGGKLLEAAQRYAAPTIRIPGGLMPRAALGYIAVPILVVLERLGLIRAERAPILETAALFERLAERYGAAAPVAGNPAKAMARQIAGRTPLVYGSLEHLDGVAWRWKNQFGENSKLLAFWNAVPALHHDEIVGWDGPREMTRQFAAVFLRDPADPDKIRRRIDITREILADRAGAVLEATAEGESLLTRLFSLVYLGDFISLYLPILRGVDPTPVAVIDLFKEKMAQPPGQGSLR